MNIMMFMFILGSLFISHCFGLFTSENVVFQKTNEIFINDAHWYVTFVHDLRPFQHLINQIQFDLKNTDEINMAITKAYQGQNMTGYVETFQSLHVEADLLTDDYTSVYNNFDEYQTMSYKRNERSLIPIIGQLMNTKQKYEVYKVHNLPMPLHHLSAESNNYLVKYNLETEMLMVSEDRTKFSVLSENTYQLCNGYHYQFCNPETAFYQT